MAICPICGKLSDDELDTNKGLCSLECQEQWHRVVEIIVPPEPPPDAVDYDGGK
jgi:hypothetical protein